MEKVAIAKGRALGDGQRQLICCTRYGNVMASRGSVIPFVGGADKERQAHHHH